MARKSAEKAVADLRARIAELKAERRQVQSQPASADEAEAAIDRFIAAQAQRYRETSTVERLKARGVFEGFGEIGEPFLCFALGDSIKAALMAEMDGGTSRQARAETLQRIDADLFEHEQQEEQAITEAEASGQSITRRPDADPRAVLGLDQ